MNIKSLSNSTISDITKCFNLSFSDYAIPFQLSEEDMRNKFEKEDISLDLSFGAFNDKEELCGLILHGERNIDGKRTFYNGGTGVIPDARGQKLTSRIYQFALDYFKENNFHQGVLEVLGTNVTASRIYENIGFQFDKELLCYTGSLLSKDSGEYSMVEKKLSEKYTDILDWEMRPTWQFTNPSLLNAKKDFIVVEANKNETLRGYVIYEPSKKRIVQLYVYPMYGRQKVGTSLLAHLARKHDAKINLINIDENALGLRSFLEATGFDINLRQFEMSIRL